jgi:hypothetical protein
MIVMTRENVSWALVCVGALVAVVLVPLLLLLGPLNPPGDVAGHLSAILTFVAALATATVSFISITVKRGSDRRQQQENARAAERLKRESEQAARRLKREHDDEEARLRLDAAMRAGALFSAESGLVQPASVASGLLALTDLDRADLAVALLVDFWPVCDQKVSTEAAILVIDAALRATGQPKAQLVAAELLCRNAKRLDSRQSLHWPSIIDGCWDYRFGPKTKLLLIDALTIMTLSNLVTEGSLRSVAVRLYGIYRGDKDPCVKGCVAKLIDALIPALDHLGYGNFMQGNEMVMLSSLKDAAAGKKDNPDDYLKRLADRRSRKLTEWARPLLDKDLTSEGEDEDDALASCVLNPIPVQRDGLLNDATTAGISAR